MLPIASLDLFAGIPLASYPAATEWYQRLLGSQPAQQETYANGVRRITYHDRDGNEIGFGGAPLTK
jgi:hypothetical protein